jgi:hypothetical protein
MKNGLALLVNEGAETTRRVVDVVKGEARDENFRAGDYCRRLGIRYHKLTSALADEVLYERTNKKDGATTPVRLGDLGPFVLVKIVDGEIRNGYSAHDCEKALRLSAETLRDLAEIFGGKPSESE